MKKKVEDKRHNLLLLMKEGVGRGSQSMARLLEGTSVSGRN